ncbi:ABC transporter permease [Petroclostridium sp. X23]|uniref:ABC transporter permease n=1 Tax=Petroclostridium sp. X23 TaxID=3045146 RepID=UPI0024AE760C|nr:ABC transporter permease [Petroclostridium sp. X23]WHH61578.1 ABC transporter permease [Petroclostridium sp. X23]
MQMVIILSLALLVLTAITIAGMAMDPQAYAPDYSAKKLDPSFIHLFGTDYLGRDMFFRTVKGLSTSILIGLLAATISSVISLILGILSAMAGGKVDKLVNWAVDLCMGMPHIVMLMLISFMMGRGIKGVIIGVAVTHWPNLTRVVRAEVMQIRSAQYVEASRKLGKNNWWIAKKHIIPHVFPQYIVGLILLFPHAILHEASITFLGYGLPMDMPAIGVILSEAMKHLATGMWWLAFFPGLALLMVVMMFDAIGENLKTIIDPYSAHE